MDQKARIQSATKSVTSALVGIALEQGCLSSVEQEMLAFFPEVAGQITNPRKEQITIREMLQMRAGYPWEESHPALWEGLLSGHYVPLIEDATQRRSGHPIPVQQPDLRTGWASSSTGLAAHISSPTLRRTSLADGCEPGEWGINSDGHNNGCGDLHLTARDMAKFGQLYLDDGVYQGNQIVPADSVRDSLQTYSEDVWDDIGRFHDIGYGYHWWSARASDHDVNFAWGPAGS